MAERQRAGHINHSLFWKNLAPSASEGRGNGGVLKDGPLKTAILETFGTFDQFKKEFNTMTAGIQGSGWGWIVSPIASSTASSASKARSLPPLIASPAVRYRLR